MLLLLLLQLLLSESRLPLMPLLVLLMSLLVLVWVVVVVMQKALGATNRWKEEEGKEAVTRKKYEDRGKEGKEGMERGQRRTLVCACSSASADLAGRQEDIRERRAVNEFVGKDCAACWFCRW